jgi:DNA-directed RNA polymerase specialized sigma24 family protein
VDEACSFAWVQLLGHQPERESVAGWLWRVAVREVWRLEAAEHRQQELREDRSEARDAIGPRHRWVEALEAVSSLRSRQRRLLGLQAAGHTYDEIVATTGDSWRTVDRQLVRARKRLAAAQ